MRVNDDALRRRLRQAQRNQNVRSEQEPSTFRRFVQKPMKFYIGLTLAIIIFLFNIYFFFQFGFSQYLNERSTDVQSKYKYPSEWSTYRSGHYFSLKNTHRKSAAFGLMWHRHDVDTYTVDERHECDINHRIAKYTWTFHDGHSFGVQDIHDKYFSMNTSYMCLNSNSWAARITVSNSQNESHSRPEIVLIPYFAVEQDATANHFENMVINQDQGYIELSGRVPISGNKFVFRIIPQVEQVIFTNVLNGILTPPLLGLNHLYRSNLFLEPYPLNISKYMIVMKDRLKLMNKKPISLKEANVFLNQLIAKTPFTLLFQYTESDFNFNSLDYDKEIGTRLASFTQDFKQKFPSIDNHEISSEMSYAALSNMLGSIGLFHGKAKVRLFTNEDREKEHPTSPPVTAIGPYSLLTAVPSRANFPRGFLWDEGFHQLIIVQYNRYLFKSIIDSWFTLMDKDGWIPREVILGPEAESRVPSEFIIQSNLNANPPTFFLAFEKFIDTIKQETHEQDIEFLKEMFPKLQIWYDWLNKTQSGHKTGTYRWRGRKANDLSELNPKTLTSGLDDYPRPTVPNQAEIHVDLFCWMALASKVMGRIGQLIQDSNHAKYSDYYHWLIEQDFINKNHWSTKHSMYCDFGLHSSNVSLEFDPKLNQKVRRIIQKPVYQCVAEFGYVSLFPFLMKLIKPTDDRLFTILQRLKDTDQLWTDYGLRSLSAQSSYYNVYNTQHDPPYWRGSVWININYLALQALKHYSQQQGPYAGEAQTLHKSLRHNLIRNIGKRFRDQGYIYEQYDDRTGSGKGAHPFTGWSSLVLLIMDTQSVNESE